MENKTKFKQILFIAMIAATLLISCSKGNSKGADGSKTPQVTTTEIGNPKASIKLRGLIGSWNTMASTAEDRKEYYRKKMTKFAQEHPDVYIELDLIPGGQTAQAMTKLLNAALAGNAHDFANIDSQWVGNFQSVGVLKSIDSMLAPEDAAQFFDFTKEVTTKDGVQYGLWAEGSEYFYYYNTAYIPEAPQNWAELLETQSQVQAVNPDITTILLPIKSSTAATTFLPFFWGLGGTLFDQDDDFRPVFGEGANRVAMKETLEFLYQLYTEKLMPAEVISFGHDDLRAEAISGKVASMISGSWVYNTLPEGWKYASIPQKKGAEPASLSGGWTFGFFSEDEKKRQLAVDFIQTVYTSKEAMTERLPLHGYIPTRKDVFAEPAFQNEFYQAIATELENAHARPITPLYPDFEVLIEEAIGKMLSGSNDIDALISSMFDDISSKYDETH